VFDGPVIVTVTVQQCQAIHHLCRLLAVPPSRVIRHHYANKHQLFPLFRPSRYIGARSRFAVFRSDDVECRREAPGE